jgi:hypothetical protein
MAEQQQQQQQPTQQQQQAPQAGAGRGALGATSPKKPLAARLAGAVANHAYASLAIIIVLLILVIGLVVYYRGFLFLGPYAGKRAGARGSRRKDPGPDEGGADDKGDPETERLIESINRQ